MGRSQIIRRRESLVLCKSFDTLWCRPSQESESNAEDRRKKKVQNYYYPLMCVYQLMEKGGVMSEPGGGGGVGITVLHIYVYDR